MNGGKKGVNEGIDSGYKSKQLSQRSKKLLSNRTLYSIQGSRLLFVNKESNFPIRGLE